MPLTDLDFRNRTASDVASAKLKLCRKHILRYAPSFAKPLDIIAYFCLGYFVHIAVFAPTSVQLLDNIIMMCYCIYAPI